MRIMYGIHNGMRCHHGVFWLKVLKIVINSMSTNKYASTPTLDVTRLSQSSGPSRDLTE